MRLYLTIGELAKLLDTSTYNIRYYEKEGLIKPTHFSDSGYRLYDYEDVNYLATIMLLRDCDISIKDIQELFKSFNYDKYQAVLKTSYQKVDEEIKRLQAVKKEILAKLNGLKGLDHKEATFQIKKLSPRKFYHIKSSDFDMNYPIKELYDLYDQYQLDMKGFYKSDIHLLIRDQDIILGLIDNNHFYDLTTTDFSMGEYLCYNFVFDSNEELEERIEEMFDFLHQHQLIYESELLFIIEANISFLNDANYTGELQIRIDNNNK